MGTKFLNTFFLLLGIFFLATFLNFSSNPPTGRTGAPLEGGGNEPTCMICHNPANPAFAGNIVISGLPASIDANTTYTITATLTATAGSPVRGGFQMVVLNSSFQNIGTLTESSPNLGIESSGGRSYMEHRNAVNFSGNTVNYTFDWQAPSNPDGEVITMYAIGNIANGSGTANDLIVQTTQSGTLVAAGDPLAVSITASSNVSCFGGNDGTATATATGGSGGYNFNWSGGQTGMMATGLSAGMATVTVTDTGSGATETANVMITQPADINLNISNQTDVTCFSPSGSATVSASGGTPGYSFLWDNGETNATAVNLTTGQHFVTVTDANSCPKSTSVTIGQDVSPPDADAGGNMIINCNNPTAVLNGTNSSSGANFTYLWTTANGNILSGATTNVPTVNAGGTYQILVTNTINGCTATDQVNVSADFDPPTANAGANVSICEGNETTLMATATGGSGGYTFNWDNGLGAGTSQTVSPNTTTTYTVTATDSNGCTNTDQVTVTVNALPSVTITGDTDFCEDASSLLDAGAGFSSYSWDTGATTQTITVDMAGTYCVTVTDGNGCLGEDCITITENPLPTVSITGNLSFCEGMSTTLNATGGFTTYLWSTNESTQNITVNVGGEYSVTATDANGCTAEASVTVTEDASPIVTITGDTDFCEGASSTLDAGAGFSSYTWDTGQSTQTITVNATGTYCVTVTDGNGCMGTDCIDITVNSLPTISSISSDCAVDLLTYMVNLTTNGDQITSTAGMVSDNGGGSFTISNIPSGTNITITATNTTTTCFSEMSVNAPDCSCPSIEPPTSGGDIMVCEGDAIPALIVNPPNGTVADWYDAVSGGNLLQSASNSFTPAAAGTFFVESRDPANNCISNSRTAVTLTINPNPIINISSVDCSIDLTSYQVNISTNADQITSSAGTVVNNGGGSFSINDIPIETNINITATNSATGCNSQTSVNAPNCDCPDIDAPTASSDTDVMICEGDDIPAFTANAPNGMVVDWYDAATGGNLLQSASSSFTPTIAGTYFAESRDPATTCTSTTRTVFNLTIHPLPNLAISGNLSFCEGTSTTLDAGTGFISYNWNNGESTQTITINTPGTYCVTAFDANGCRVETCVEVIENPNPVITITGDLFFCAGECTIVSWGTGVDEMQEICVPGTYTVSVTDENGCMATTSFDVIENPNPIADAGEDIVLTCVTTSVTIGGNSSIGANIAYEWSNGSTSATQEIMASGTYVLTVTNTETGCSSTDEVIITEDITVPTVDAGADFVMPCVGPSPVLNGMVSPNNNIIIEWMTADGNITSGSETLSPEIDSPGTYILTVTNTENGCSASDMVVVSAAELPVISVNEIIHVLCNGEMTGSITVSASGGTAPYTYLWDDMGSTTSSTLSNIPAGAYTCSVTDANGCASMVSITITEPVSIVIILTATAESANGANDGSISSMISGGTAPYVYLWSTGSMEEMISGLAPETYSLVITDANGCTQSASAQVNAFGCEDLMATTSGNLLICPGSSDGSISIDVISGGEAPYLIMWSTGSSDAAVSDLSAGHYSNTITDVNNCALISEFDIAEGDTIPPNLVTQNISIYLDENGEASFEPADIDGGSTDNCGIGEFFVDNTSFDCSHIGENTVQVAVFDTGILCDADSAIVTVLDTFPPVFTLCPEDIFTLNCLEVAYEMPVAMDNCGEITMELIEGFASGTSFPIGTTLVTYQATDASGNSATCSFEVVLTSEISIILTPTAENEMDSDGTISSLVTGVALPITYEWTNATGEIISTEESLTGVSTGDYCLTIIDANGCSETVCTTVDRIVAVNDPALTANIHIAPNPASNQLYVNFDLENNEAATLILYDMNGRVIFQTQKEKGNDKLQIDVSAFANGIYLLKIIVEEQVAVKKILVSK